MKTHDNQKPFQCTVCNRGYNTAAALTSHMQNHKKAAAEGSGGSGTLSGTRSGRSSAEGTPSPGILRCLQCGDVFRKPEHLQVCSQQPIWKPWVLRAAHLLIRPVQFLIGTLPRDFTSSLTQELHSRVKMSDQALIRCRINCSVYYQFFFEHLICVWSVPDQNLIIAWSESNQTGFSLSRCLLISEGFWDRTQIR